MFRLKSTSRVHSGLTLVEVLVAMTMTLIVLGSMMAAFRYASTEMADGRAMIELTGQLRTAEQRLISDLNGLTVQPRVYTRNSVPPGMFEYTEGFLSDNSSINSSAALGTGISDADLNNAPANPDNYLGDPDDILHMTVRSSGEPFRGRYRIPGAGAYGSDTDRIQIIESSLAEIIYYTLHDDRNDDGLVQAGETIKLYRRVLLIRPDINLSAFAVSTVADIDLFFQLNDLSARVEGGVFASNTLEDLACRQNRFCHGPETATAPATDFPFPLQVYDLGIPNPGYSDRADANLPGALARRRIANRIVGGVPEYSGADILLDAVTAFDIRVYSPDAAVANSANLVVQPGDIGALQPNGTPRLNSPAVTGAFIDLGFTRALFGATGPSSSLFSNRPNVLSQLQGAVITDGYVYDTWTPEYEQNGRDEDGSGSPDQGIDGLDNNNANGVDDNAERETQPPYGHPIRGLEIRMRIKEDRTIQSTQATVLKSFVPE